MLLKTYRRKRDFERTPEPSASGEHEGAFLHFVVQEHHASRLHYDFRLELNGVLKSWAVPKGISTKPQEKRLAVMVEDHPLEYRHFSGTIPEGNYGAGTVKIWDEGVYYVSAAGDRRANERAAEAGIRKGHLDLVLDGNRLKGAYSLIHFKEGKNWLIIKKREHTDPRALPETAGLSESSFPPFIEPMLARVSEGPFDRSGWLFEPKWDGYRAIAAIHRHDARLYSRNNKSFNERFPSLAAELHTIADDMVLDGEIVAEDSAGRSSFQRLQNFVRTGESELRYYAFDILYYRHHDLRALPLADRKRVLARALPPLGHVLPATYIEERGKEYFSQTASAGGEGIMAKDMGSPYRSGIRSDEWLKIKALHRQEAVICGFTEPTGQRSYFGALVLGAYSNGKLEYIGHAGGGFDEPSLANVYAAMKPLVTDVPPFAEPPATNTPATWVRPELVCEVSFVEWTWDGRMRQPIFLGLRDDKNAREVVREMAPARSAAREQASAPVQQPRLTNRTKVFWHVEGYTKGDLLDYYERIAPVLLPYLADRPESLRRQPDGIDGKEFIQKDVSRIAPPWVATADITDELGQKAAYILCQNRETLLYMVNLGCIEINPWNARIGSLDRPDYMIFDFDPLGVPFDDVVEAVVKTHEVLDRIEAVNFCKTSGATGLHVYVPLGARYSFEQAESFAHLVALVVHSLLPLTTAVERTIYRRNKKVYLDYMQNRRAQTLAAPYSVRPRRGATVATPLTWSEVKQGLDPASFTMLNTFKRLEACADPGKGILGAGIDMRRSLALFEQTYKERITAP